MKNIRSLVALSVISVFLAGTASATTSGVNPNVPAQNSPLSSSVLRGQFGAVYSDDNTQYGILTLSSNQLLGTVNAGMAGGLNVPSCAAGALSWTPGTGFGCNSLNGLVSPITQSLIFTGADSFNLNALTLPTKQVGTVLQLGNADTIASRVENDAFAASAYFTGIRSDGTNAAPTTLQSGDEIVGFNAWGYNGSSIVGPRAGVRMYADQNWTGSAQGTHVDIATALNGTTSTATVCRFENDGGVTCPATVTGGSQGAGRINAAGLFVNGVAVSTGASSLSALTAALGSNSIENGANAQVWNFDTLSTQTALQLTGTGVTTGQLFNSSVANAASTGYAGYFSNTGTAASYGIKVTDASTGAGYGVYSTVSGAANTGYAGYFINSSTGGYAVYANGKTNIAGSLTTTSVALSVVSTAFSTDASAGNYFYVTLPHSGATTANAPTNPTDGQVIMYELSQDGTGSGTVSWNAAYDFGTAGAPTLTTTASKVDLVGFRYSARNSKWNYLGNSLGM